MVCPLFSLVSINIFAVSDFNNQNYHDFVLNLVNYPVIANTHLVKRVVSPHFGDVWIRQLMRESVNLFTYSFLF